MGKKHRHLSKNESLYSTRTKDKPIDAGLIRTDASEENRFLVYRIRPLCHCALADWIVIVVPNSHCGCFPTVVDIPIPFPIYVNASIVYNSIS